MMKELKDRRVIVVGTGKSGIGSAVLLEKMAHCQCCMTRMIRQTKKQ